MTLSTEEVRRAERIHVRAWPALETARIDGWLWRHSGGASKRANSVSTLEFTGADPAAALDKAEARYRTKGARPRIQTFDAGRPRELASLLATRGYAREESTITMWKPVEPAVPSTDVDVAPEPSAGWLDVYLGAITLDRRAINAKILANIPQPRAYFAFRRDGAVISTALSVADDGLAVVECVATHLDARRSGAAKAVMVTLEAWAARQGAQALALQVVSDNAPALTFYGGYGFKAIANNHYWVKA